MAVSRGTARIQLSILSTKFSVHNTLSTAGGGLTLGKITKLNCIRRMWEKQRIQETLSHAVSQGISTFNSLLSRCTG